MQKVIGEISICSFIVLCLAIFSVPDNADADPYVRNKRKPSAVLKTEGYYCIVKSGDGVIEGEKTSSVKKEAEERGYLTVEQFCGTFAKAVTPETLLPGKEITIQFKMKHDVYEKVVFSKFFDLPVGTYEMTLSCTSSTLTGTTNLSSVIEIPKVGDIESSSIFYYMQANQNSYSEQLQFPLEEPVKNGRLRVLSKRCFEGSASLKRIS